MDADNVEAQATAAPPVRQRSCSPAGFTQFFREQFRPLMRVALLAGATRQEAEEAAQATLVDLLMRWDDVVAPGPYARRAVLNTFIKAKRSGLDRIRQRQVQFGAASPGSREDAGLRLWEDTQWVTQLLDSLPPRQLEVMAAVVDGFTPAEVAEVLGRTPEAVRQNLREARIRLRQDLGSRQPAGRTASAPGKEGR